MEEERRLSAEMQRADKLLELFVSLGLSAVTLNILLLISRHQPISIYDLIEKTGKPYGTVHDHISKLMAAQLIIAIKIKHSARFIINDSVIL